MEKQDIEGQDKQDVPNVAPVEDVTEHGDTK